MKAIVKFLGRHWIATTIIVVVIFGVVLPNVEAIAVSSGSSLIQMILGGC